MTLKKGLKCVLNSDSINRYNYRFSVGTLNDAFKEKNALGIPTLISHDGHRPIGWTVPQCLYVSGNMTRLVGETIFPADEEESKSLKEMYRRYLSYKNHEQIEPHIDKLKEKFKDDFDSTAIIALECAAINKDKIALKYFPELFSDNEKNGLTPLVKLKSFKYLGAGVFQKGELVCFAHRYFRRSLSLINNTNSHFLDAFIKLNGKDVDAWIAIDPDLVGIAISYLDPIELEYWRGPKFDDDLSAITPGLTKHVADERQKLYQGTAFTEFWWQSRKGEHILEAEEVIETQTFSRPFSKNDNDKDEQEEEYGCRYVHSIINEVTKKIEHLDGSIRFYNFEEICERMDIDLTKTERDKKYKKLWKLNGNISLSDWKSLIDHYYKGNSLVGEYFGYTDKNINVLEIEKGEDLEDLVKKYVPYSLIDGAGVLLSISYEQLGKNDVPISNLEPVASYNDSDQKWLPYFNSFALEFIKLMNKRGEEIIFPQDISFIGFKDMYYDLPIYVFDGDKERSKKAFQCIKDIADWSIRSGNGAGILFSLKYPIDEKRYIVLSFYSNDVSLSKFSDLIIGDKILLPSSNSGIEQFVENVKCFNGELDQSKLPHLFDLLDSNGRLFLKRLDVDSTFELKLVKDDQTKCINWQIQIPRGAEKVVEAMANKGLAPCLSMLFQKKTCRKCGNNYFKCTCTKSLDRAVVEITKCRALSGYWSDRPVYDSSQKVKSQFIAKPPPSSHLTTQSIARNALCPCGSGKKYKRCCFKR